MWSKRLGHPEIITRPEEVALLRTIARMGNPLIYLRFQAAIALLFDSGMRRQELLLCNVEDLRQGCARIPNLKRRERGAPLFDAPDARERIEARRRKGKNGQLEREDVRGWREIPLPDDAIQAWRFLAGGRGTGILLPGALSNKRMSGARLWQIWREAWIASGLRPGQNPPPLKATRKTFATRLMLNGVHMRTIQMFLGHTQATSTERYLPVGLLDMHNALRSTGQRLLWSALD